MPEKQACRARGRGEVLALQNLAPSTCSHGATLWGKVVEHDPHLVALSLPVRSRLCGTFGYLQVAELSCIRRCRRVSHGYGR
jgi:hypothetical protein